jgi:superfamily II DNA/RNA helicase
MLHQLSTLLVCATSLFEESMLMVLENLANITLGFEKPSAIQQRAIKPIVKGRDVIAQFVD